MINKGYFHISSNITVKLNTNAQNKRHHEMVVVLINMGFPHGVGYAPEYNENLRVCAVWMIPSSF
ncbi:MAG: hypothetical protein AB9903_08490 [Vulcanimicrobiota bacterium]